MTGPESKPYLVLLKKKHDRDPISLELVRFADIVSARREIENTLNAEKCGSLSVVALAIADLRTRVVEAIGDKGGMEAFSFFGEGEERATWKEGKVE
ncbi:MAG: hypothetical protein V1936_00935 [Patescibacteria group bacterium]